MENLQPNGYVCRYKSPSHFPADTCSTFPLPLAGRRGRWENWPWSSCWFILLFWTREFILISWMNESVPLFQMIRVSVCPWNISQLHCDIRNKIHCVFLNLNAFPILMKYTCRWYLTWLWRNRSLGSSKECMCQQGHQNVSTSSFGLPLMLLNVFMLNLSSEWLMISLLLIWIQFSCYYSAVGFHNWSVLLQITFGWVSLLQDSPVLGGNHYHITILLYFNGIFVFLTFIINVFTKTFSILFSRNCLGEVSFYMKYAFYIGVSAPCWFLKKKTDFLTKCASFLNC